MGIFKSIFTHLLYVPFSDQIRSDIGLLGVDKRNSTIHSRNDITQ